MYAKLASFTVTQLQCEYVCMVSLFREYFSSENEQIRGARF